MLGNHTSAGPTEGPEGLESTASAVVSDGASVRSVLVQSGPRFVRDAFGPLLAFYVGWKASGIVVGIVVATGFATLAWGYERRHGRPGMVARLSLSLVLIHAVIGIGTHSATIYLAQPLLVSGALGLTFTISTVLGRPLAGVFATEMFPFSEETRSSDQYRRVFGRVSLAWGTYLLVHCGALLAVLFGWGVDVFVLVNVVTSAPIVAALLTWSIWYAVTSLRRAEQELQVNAIGS